MMNSERTTWHSRPVAASTLVELLLGRAETQPERTLYTFLADGEQEDVHVTYREVDRQARMIAAALQQRYAPGERALLLYPPGLSYIAAFFGCLYAGIVAVPAYPPNPVRLQRALGRLRSIAQDARPAVALTTPETYEMGALLAAQEEAFQRIEWLATDTLEGSLAQRWQPPKITPDTTAFLQYTSGSTAMPKGVVLSHRNLLHNSAYIHRCFGHSAESQGVIWLPPYHDMGLIGGIIQPLYGGFPVALLSPVSFLQRPLRWLEAISRTRATTSGGPNFAYDLCVRKITPEQHAQLDLSSWSVAFNGAEPVRAETLERFAATFANCGFRREAFYPCYGLAEATLIVSGGLPTGGPVVGTFGPTTPQHDELAAVPAETPGARRLVSSGQVLPDEQLVIVHPETRRPCQPGQIGEICVASASVAQGYWNRPAESAEVFQQRLPDYPDTLFLRTNDLGFLHEGELYVTGRIKDLIIIRGRNYYPQDIELTVEASHPALRPGCGAAFTIDVDGAPQLVIVQELDRQLRNPDSAALSGLIRQVVAEQHELHVHKVVLIKHGSILKTSSGKIQRAACRTALLGGTLKVIGESAAEDMATAASAEGLTRAELLAASPEERPQLAEQFIQAQLARLLHLPAHQLDRDSSTAALGLDSLMAVELQHRLETSLGVLISMARVLQGPSIAELAQDLLAASADAQADEPVASVASHDDHPLSYGQAALWFIHQLSPDSAAYNIAGAARIRTQLERPAFERAVQRLVERHAALRTTFPAPNGAPVQHVAERIELPCYWQDVAAWSTADLDARLLAEANRPFDLRHGPLLRMIVFSRAEDDHVLLLVMHHIITDLWSLALLVRELAETYAAERRGQALALASLTLQYVDFVRWQRAWLDGPAGARLWSYWRAQLSDPPQLLNLPFDFPRPSVQRYHGAARHAQLDTALLQALRQLSETHQVTLSTTLLTTFFVLLARYTGQADLLVGLTTSGRSRAQLTDLVGYFANPVVIRASVHGQHPFAALLAQVHTTVLAALEHQDYPLSLLVERLQPERDAGRTPLFQVLFSMQQTPGLDGPGLASFALGGSGQQLRLGELTLESVALSPQTAQFDLAIVLAETTAGLGVMLQYNRDLFAPDTIARMLDHFATLLQAIAAQPVQAVADLPLLTDDERQALLAANHATRADYPRDRCVHQLIAEQAERRPDAIAIQFEGQTLRYGELERRASQLAYALRAAGVGPETLVGLCIERSCDMLVGLLGILKAGGAYIPLDPTYPEQRLHLMLDDARAAFLVTEAALCGRFPDYHGQLICLDTGWDTIAAAPPVPLGAASPHNLAYVIYTSGSTGRPKGVQISHQALVNFLTTMAERPGLSAEDRLLAVTTVSFDIAGLELFLPLIVGARVVLTPRAVTMDGRRLAALIRDSQATLMQATPATWRLLLETGWSGSPDLRILSGGEALPRDLANSLVDLAAEVWNMYGPTETTIWSTLAPVVAGDGPVVIGRPIANTQIYILDEMLQPLPVGVAGELYIGGDGVTRGYLNRPDLTVERCIPDPFGATPGARLYRTGDLARVRADGQIECLGRLDHQVKVRGYRIELGEIEARLAQHPQISAAVVVARADGAVAGEQRLLGYIVPQSGATPTTTELGAFLRQSLPGYMVPASFTTLEALPLTPNGKVNHRALPSPTPALAAAAQPTAPDGSSSRLEQLISHVWQDVLQIEQISPNDNFFDLGGHSLLLARVHSRLQAQVGDELTIVELLQYPTIRTLAAHLSARSDGSRLSAPPPRPALSARHVQGDTPVAIIGMAGRFPGAASPETLWTNLCQGIESITFFSDEELLAAGVEPELVQDPSYVKARATVDAIDQFDAAFFGFTPREAELLDPQHRLFLESAWQALDHAGYDPSRYAGRVGVYAGVGVNTYLMQANRDFRGTANSYQAFIANDKDFAATRTSYKLNLRGPSVTVQTACSSSLVAVHLACQSLLSGECDMALAGGVSVGLPQQAGYLYEPGNILSPDGHCRAFDAEARGTVFGSGAGLVVLKPLADALRDGDTVYAVIKGSAINNDGAGKIGYTAPSVDGQAEVIAAALAAARVDPATIGYIEAHGTGTELGDPIEIAALTQVYGAASDWRASCAVGSIKTNIGHLDTAAGVAGLIKTALTLKHKQIPPSLHFEQPNPKIDFASSPFYVNTALTPWPTNGHPRRAAVSSFGIGGTNVHVVLEEAPPAPESADRDQQQLLILSAKTPSALEQASADLVAHLRQHPAQSLADIAYTLQVGRRSFVHRRIVVCDSHGTAIELLERADPERVLSTVWDEQEPALVWMFSGQGAQYVGMGQGLYQSQPTFRATVDRCCQLLEPHLQLDLRDVLFAAADADQRSSAAPDPRHLLEQTSLAQPALFVIEYALAQLWISWGIRPASMIGHSIGEYVAATLADVFTLEEALAVVARRGQLMQRASGGAMLSIGLPATQLTPWLDGQLAIAAFNSPQTSVVAGPHAEVDALEQRLQHQDIPCRRLHTSHAFHSPLIDSILDDFALLLGQIQLSPPTRPFVSNVTGDWITAAQATDPSYWVRHARQPVQFAAGLQTCLTQPHTILLEVGPGNALTTLARQQAQQHLAVASLRHPHALISDETQLLTSVGKLWLNGVAVEWPALYQGQQRRRVALPSYPFERQRFWLEPLPRTERAQPVERSADIRQWLSTLLWRQSLPLPPFVAATPGDTAPCWLLLLDQCGLGRRIAERLRQAGQTVITVEIGDQLRLEPSDAYQIDPGQRNHYQALLDQLIQRGQYPQTILHLWNVDALTLPPLSDESLARTHTLGFQSALYLAQALGAHDGAETTRLLLITNNMQQVTDEDLLYPEKATVLGPCRVIPQEYPQISSRCIDVVLPQSPARQERLAELLLAECAASGDDLVAYRGLGRWTPAAEQVPIPTAAPAVQLREGGVYLITGGLGGIGLTLAQQLARESRVRLALLSRTGLLARSAWDDWLAQHGPHDRTSRQIQQVYELEQLGAEVLVVQADVADRQSLRAALDLIHARFGALHGVIHAAGVPGGGVIQRKTPEAAAAVLAPKVQGVQRLYTLLKDAPLDFVLLCSSITSLTGGFGQVDYCGANAFLDAFARSQPLTNQTRVMAINWARWQEVGMAVEAAQPQAAGAHTAQPLRQVGHPLVAECLAATAEHATYRVTLTVATHWVLAEHRILGLATVPGTTYLEMVRAAFTDWTGCAAMELREVMFLAPLTLHLDETREALLQIERSDDDQYAFRVLSRPLSGDTGATGEQGHASGTIRPINLAPSESVALHTIIARCQPFDLSTVVPPTTEDGQPFLEAGPRWQNLQQVYLGEHEAVMRLELAEQFSSDLQTYLIHPALLDVATGAVQYRSSGNYLPLAYEQISIGRPLTREIYSYVRYRPQSSPDMLTCDLTLLDAHGGTLCTISAFRMRRLSDEIIVQFKLQAGTGQRTQRDPAAGRASVDAYAELVVGDSIHPAEGAAVFQHLLALALPELVVSPRPLAAVLEQARALTGAQLLERLGALAADKPTHARPNIHSPYIAPENDLERQIAEIWQRVLGIEQVGVHDNFFELGGTSLTTIQLTTELKKALGIDIPTVSVFEAPTISALARLLNPEQAAPSVLDQGRSRAKKIDEALSRQMKAMRQRRK